MKNSEQNGKNFNTNFKGLASKFYLFKIIVIREDYIHSFNFVTSWFILYLLNGQVVAFIEKKPKTFFTIISFLHMENTYIKPRRLGWLDCLVYFAVR